MRAVAFCLLLPVLATGCLHEPGEDDTGLYQPAYAPPPQPVARREFSVAWEGLGGDVPALVPASSPLTKVPDPVPFRIGAGHGALGALDLAPCRAEGLQAGYLRMRVTFRRDGRIVHAAVESPEPPPQEALECIADQLQGAKVPAFDGRDASLSRSFFVEPGAEPEDTVVRSGHPRAGESLSRLGRIAR
jgi:hypothetical protein